MSALVLDVSACMPWCCEDESTPASERLLRRAGDGDRLHVPSLWPWEIMNAVAVAARRNRITPDQASAFLGVLAGFSFEIAPAAEVEELPRLQALATRHRLTAYDAAYLDLAQRLGIPLATLDADLMSAAIAEGVAIL